MRSGEFLWWSLEQAARHFGYSHPENMRQRLRELRKRGEVLDLGYPPPQYRSTKRTRGGKVVIYWPNPKTALMRNDAPGEMFVPKRGRRVLKGGQD